MKLKQITRITLRLHLRKLELEESYLRFYTKFGLGKTTLEFHVVGIGDATPKKMKYFPVSPAVQKLTYAELDRMLERDVIEVAKDDGQGYSSWKKE